MDTVLGDREKLNPWVSYDTARRPLEQLGANVGGSCTSLTVLYSQYMRPLSPEQEQQLVEALLSLDWMTNHDRKSCTVIREQLGCTMTEAIEVLRYLHLNRNLIRAKYPSPEDLRCVPISKDRWKWERGLGRRLPQ